jgi:hypothetical protein
MTKLAFTDPRAHWKVDQSYSLADHKHHCREVQRVGGPTEDIVPPQGIRNTQKDLDLYA